MCAALSPAHSELRMKILSEAAKHVQSKGFTNAALAASLKSINADDVTDRTLRHIFSRGFPIALVEHLVKHSNTHVQKELEGAYSKDAILKNIDANLDAFIHDHLLLPTEKSVAETAILAKLQHLLPLAPHWPSAIALEYLPSNIPYTVINAAEFVDTTVYYMERVATLRKLLEPARRLLKAKSMVSHIPLSDSGALDMTPSTVLLRSFLRGVPLSSAPHANSSNLQPTWFCRRAKLALLYGSASASLLGDNSRNAAETRAMCFDVKTLIRSTIYLWSKIKSLKTQELYRKLSKPLRAHYSRLRYSASLAVAVRFNRKFIGWNSMASAPISFQIKLVLHILSSMIRCEFAPGRGRFVVAATAIAAGATIFREEAYCVAQRIVDSKRIKCVYCCAKVALPYEVCTNCGSSYCSSECKIHHHKHHETTGECCAVILTKLARSVVAEEDMDTFEMICLILGRCASESKEILLSRLPSGCDHDPFETVGFHTETASPLQFLNTGGGSENFRRPTFDHVECLGTNKRDTDPEILKDFSELYNKYQTMLHRKKYIQKVRSLSRHLPQNVSRETFVALCNAFLCNGFGIRDSANNQLGVALYPQSSFFNHSCAPNMGRRNLKRTRVIEFFAARQIEPGEPLCISYVDLKLPASERKAKLKATYSFECTCLRCDSNADFFLADTVCSSHVPALCCNCISKVIQPLGNGKFVCPCCEKTQELC